MRLNIIYVLVASSRTSPMAMNSISSADLATPFFFIISSLPAGFLRPAERPQQSLGRGRKGNDFLSLIRKLKVS
jgi:hypothetical protein